VLPNPDLREAERIGRQLRQPLSWSRPASRQAEGMALARWPALNELKAARRSGSRWSALCGRRSDASNAAPA